MESDASFVWSSGIVVLRSVSNKGFCSTIVHEYRNTDFNDLIGPEDTFEEICGVCGFDMCIHLLDLLLNSRVERHVCNGLCILKI